MSIENAKRIKESLLKHPDEWVKYDEYTIRHKPTGYEIWVANGLGYYGRYDDGSTSFPFIEQLYLCRAIRKTVNLLKSADKEKVLKFRGKL